jgi:hypothetical protein
MCTQGGSQTRPTDSVSGGLINGVIVTVDTVHVFNVLKVVISINFGFNSAI